MSEPTATSKPVIFIEELAALLGTSVRTIERQLRAGTFFLPELPRVDRKHRWSRERVFAAIATETAAGQRMKLATADRARKSPA